MASDCAVLIVRNELTVSMSLHNSKGPLVEAQSIRQNVQEMTAHTLVRNVTLQSITDMRDAASDLPIETGELVDVVAHASIVQGSR